VIASESLDEMNEYAERLLKSWQERNQNDGEVEPKLKAMASIAGALACLRQKDKRRWHHKPIFFVSHIF
jgi:hypothetical protein